MRLYQFKEELLQGKHCEKELNVILEMFEGSFYSMGEFKQYPEYKSFVIKPRDHREGCMQDYSELEEVFKYITEKHLKIETSVLQEPEEFIKRIDQEDISGSNKSFFKMIYAINLFKANNLEDIKCEIVYDIFGLTKIVRMLEYEYRFNIINGMIETRDFKVPISQLDKCIDLISTLNKSYGYGVYLEDNGTLILSDALGSGTTVILYARTGIIEVVQRVVCPKKNMSFLLLSSDVNKDIKYLKYRHIDLPLFWAD